MTRNNDRPAWDKGRWQDSDDVDRVAKNIFWRAVGYFSLAIGICLVLGGIVWAIQVATAHTKGTGDIYKDNQSSMNREYTQAYFEQLNGDIQGFKVKLVQAAQDKADHPGDSYYATNYTGLFNTCVQAVTDYNAAARKTLFKDWKAADLPESFDPTTTCGASASPAK